MTIRLKTQRFYSFSHLSSGVLPSVSKQVYVFTSAWCPL